jgi:hypothetical protein
MHDHDFGPYLTVVCRYDADDKVAADYAFACDSQLPPEWDDVARRELGLVT